MNWDRWDIAYAGRAAGAVIVAVGIAVAAWTTFDKPSGYPLGYPLDDSVRAFIKAALEYAFWGFVVILIAELADLMAPGTEEPEESEQLTETPRQVEALPLIPVSVRWLQWDSRKVILVSQAAGVLVLVGGIVLSVWEALDNRPFGISGAQFGNDDRIKFLLGSSLHYIFEGFVVIGLAELAARMSWGTASGNEGEVAVGDTQEETAAT